MRKVLFLALALLFVAGVANATSIPLSVDPKNNPVVWTETVYNGSGSTIVSGYIVAWDFDTADSADNQYDDMCPYVKLNATDEGVWQAGIVPYGKNIANGDTGAIVIKGPAYALIGTTTVVDTLVAGDGSGKASPFDGGANDECALGVCIKAVQVTTAIDNGADSWTLIYVDPMRFDEN